jgi:RimJ/RimL family protein N-acetyltransferase
VNRPHDIVGERLVLRLVSPEALAATVEADLAAVARLVGLTLPPDWAEVAPLAKRRLAQIETDAEYLPWSIRAIALRETGDVVGYANFHDRLGAEYLKAHAPSAVELGYEIFAAHRLKGYGGETVRMLIKWASERGADGFVFSISPGNAASLKLVARLGAVKVGSHIDEEDGPEDVYLLKSG